MTQERQQFFTLYNKLCRLTFGDVFEDGVWGLLEGFNFFSSCKYIVNLTDSDSRYLLQKVILENILW